MVAALDLGEESINMSKKEEKIILSGKNE